MSYLPNLPVSFWTARTDAKRTPGLFLPAMCNYSASGMYLVGPQWVREPSSSLSPSPQACPKQSGSRKSTPLLAQHSLIGGKGDESQEEGHLPSYLSSTRHPPSCKSCHATLERGVRTERANNQEHEPDVRQGPEYKYELPTCLPVSLHPAFPLPVVLPSTGAGLDPEWPPYLHSSHPYPMQPQFTLSPRTPADSVADQPAPLPNHCSAIRPSHVPSTLNSHFPPILPQD